jgi:DNA-binding NarL/FixJ family response regulator
MGVVQGGATFGVARLWRDWSLMLALQDVGGKTAISAALAPRAGTRRVLSARELDVLRGAAAGLTSGAIALELSISPATVKRHFENIFAKLRVHDRTAAVAYALRAGLIT